MTTTNAFCLDIDSALDEEIVNAAARRLSSAQLAYDAESGDLAGVVYYAAETCRHYAADIDSLRNYIEVIQRTASGDAYSIWCSETTPDAEGETAAAVAAEMGWTLA